MADEATNNDGSESKCCVCQNLLPLMTKVTDELSAIEARFQSECLEYGLMGDINRVFESLYSASDQRESELLSRVDNLYGDPECTQTDFAALLEKMEHTKGYCDKAFHLTTKHQLLGMADFVHGRTDFLLQLEVPEEAAMESVIEFQEESFDYLVDEIDKLGKVYDEKEVSAAVQENNVLKEVIIPENASPPKPSLMGNEKDWVTLYEFGKNSGDIISEEITPEYNPGREAAVHRQDDLISLTLHRQEEVASAELTSQDNLTEPTLNKQNEIEQITVNTCDELEYAKHQTDEFDNSDDVSQDGNSTLFRQLGVVSVSPKRQEELQSPELHRQDAIESVKLKRQEEINANNRQCYEKEDQEDKEKYAEQTLGKMTCRESTDGDDAVSETLTSSNGNSYSFDRGLENQSPSNYDDDDDEYSSISKGDASDTLASTNEYRASYNRGFDISNQSSIDNDVDNEYSSRWRGAVTDGSDDLVEDRKDPTDAIEYQTYTNGLRMENNDHVQNDQSVQNDSSRSDITFASTAIQVIQDQRDALGALVPSLDTMIYKLEAESDQQDAILTIIPKKRAAEIVVKCMYLEFDKTTVFEDNDVTPDGKLVNDPPLYPHPFSSWRFLNYKGALATRPLDSFGITYLEFQTTIEIKEVHKGRSLIFEAAVGDKDVMDINHKAEHQPVAWGLSLSNCPDDGGLCRRTWCAGQGGRHFPNTLPNEPGSKAVLRFGFLLMQKQKKLVVMDCQEEKILMSTDSIRVARPLWPVFGVYNTDLSRVETSIVSGADLSISRGLAWLIYENIET